jgi:hypothetical protein
MTSSTMIRAGAAALALALTPALAAAATPPEQHASASHNCTRRDCTCGKRQDAQPTPADAAAQAHEREAQDAFLQQVWTAP